MRLVVWEDKRESPLFQESVANETWIGHFLLQVMKEKWG